MNLQDLPLGIHERVSFSLRSLYNRYGYSRYKMGKFEEYDLYARNKDFLISDSVITFTDLSGKLMALKPDVTLSIVKNSKDDPDTLQKLYYNENVYRVSKGSHGFREIMQVGLECLGLVDDYCICEVLSLAAESLRSISQDCVLDVSHLGVLSQVLDAVGVAKDQKAAALKCVGQKNIHELAAICRSSGVTEEKVQLLTDLVTISGDPATVLPQIEALLDGVIDTAPLEQLLRVVRAMEDNKVLRFDFSVVDDVRYYDGIVFKGFIRGLPGSVLSGGQYDKLMRKMRRRSGAIGFAVYMDMLERLEDNRKAYDVDAVLLYDETSGLDAVRAQADRLTAQGCSVLVQRNVPENIRYRQLLKLCEGEVEVLENNA